MQVRGGVRDEHLLQETGGPGAGVRRLPVDLPPDALDGRAGQLHVAVRRLAFAQDVEIAILERKSSQVLDARGPGETADGHDAGAARDDAHVAPDPSDEGHTVVSQPHGSEGRDLGLVRGRKLLRDDLARVHGRDLGVREPDDRPQEVAGPGVRLRGGGRGQEEAEGGGDEHQVREGLTGP
jgi:hypothetical protein